VKRIGFLVRPPWFAVSVGFVLFVARGLASVGRTATRFPDSIGYENFSLFGGADRPWPVTAVYAAVQSDGGRVFVQVLIGCLAWVWFGHELSRHSRWPRATMIATAVLSLSPQIIRYDIAILSESLGITYAVLAVAATLQRLHHPTHASTVVWLACIALCGFTRPTHLLVIAAVCAAHIARLVSSRGRQISMVGVVVTAMMLVGAVQQRSSSNMSLLNLYTVVSSRIISDNDRFDWFVDHGMPVVDGMRTAGGYDYASDLPTDVAAVVDLPEGQQPPSLMRIGGVPLAEWLRDKGWRTLALYLATHPGDTLNHAQDLLDPTLTPPNGDFLPLDNGPMIPGFVFGHWQVWALIALGGMMILLFRTRREAFVFAAVGAVTAVVYLATVHTSGIEHVRHSVTVAAMIRVVGLSALVRALSPRELRNRSGEDASAPT
jgi:hypothetical protein